MARFEQSIGSVGIFTSGGDAPGMNAAIRAATRMGLHKQLQVIGIQNGYQGMLEGLFQDLQLRSVANILQRGGTFLKTARCPDFHKAEIRSRAIEQLRSHRIDALVCIGGDGSFRGAHALWEEHQFPCVGVPGTIDNDIYGTDVTIGFDTAVNTSLNAIDRIRDTAAAHDRLFIVEVMGRNSGHIASAVGLAGGAEDIFVPDSAQNVDQTIQKIKDGVSKGKLSSILVAAEGHKPGRAYDLAENLRKKAGLEAHVCVLGHIQRGGTPTAQDRIVASRLGAKAIELLLDGECDVMAGMTGYEVSVTPLADACALKKENKPDLAELTRILAL